MAAKITCSKCASVIPTSAAFCPQCGAKAVNVLTQRKSDAEAEKLILKMQGLQSSIERFESEFGFDSLDELDTAEEVLPLIEPLQKIANRVKKLSPLLKEFDDEELLNNRVPGFEAAISRFSLLTDELEEKIEELVGRPEQEIRALVKAERATAGPTKSKFKDDETFSSEAKKFWYWGAGISMACGFIVGLILPHSSKPAFWITSLIGISITALLARSRFTKCPECGRYIKINTSVKKQVLLGSQDGWHTETDAVTTTTTFRNNSFQNVGTGQSTSYVNRTAPHRDEFYERHFVCPACDAYWTDQIGVRFNL